MLVDIRTYKYNTICVCVHAVHLVFILFYFFSSFCLVYAVRIISGVWCLYIFFFFSVCTLLHDEDQSSFLRILMRVCVWSRLRKPTGKCAHIPFVVNNNSRSSGGFCFLFELLLLVLLSISNESIKYICIQDADLNLVWMKYSLDFRNHSQILISSAFLCVLIILLRNKIQITFCILERCTT